MLSNYHTYNYCHMVWLIWMRQTFNLNTSTLGLIIHGTPRRTHQGNILSLANSIPCELYSLIQSKHFYFLFLGQTGLLCQNTFFIWINSSMYCDMTKYLWSFCQDQSMSLHQLRYRINQPQYWYITISLFFNYI